MWSDHKISIYLYILLKMKKAQMQQFAWIFSIVVGAIVLFLAFFFVTQYGKQVEKPTKQAVLSAGIDILLEPFSAIGSLAEVRAEPIEIPKDMHIEFDCNDDNDYSEIKARGKKHKTFELTRKSYDKYIFANTIETKSKSKFLAFSLPIKIPFYVATATVIVNKDYCIKNLPQKYKESLNEIYEPIKDSIKTKLEFENCEPNQEIYGINKGRVYGKYFINQLVVAAVFSENDLYNCNLNRILKRAIRIAKIYKSKAEKMSAKGCNMDGSIEALNTYIDKAEIFLNNKNQNTLNDFYQSVQDLTNINNGLYGECKLF